ncbi:UPF0104 family protein [Synechococcus sp. M16CYN]|uniref:UPF0104 family protein n=1 Tax=Synechococcus sp. M16CYN TaxID=3103139 RepID=UPI003245E483
MDVVTGRLRSLKLWITPISLVFITVTLVRQSVQLRQQSLDVQGWLWLMLGLGLTWLSILINGWAWRTVLDWLGWLSEDLAVVPLFIRSNLRKYLPGGIWHLVERIRLLRSSIGAGPALTGVILDPLLTIAASLLTLIVGGWQSGLVILAPLPALTMIPRFREPILQWLKHSKASKLQSAGMSSLITENSDHQGYPWTPLMAATIFVLFRFAGFFCCVQAFDIYQPKISHWLAAFGLAYAIGLMTPGAPSGLGVFETILLLRLSGSVEEAPLLMITFSHRIISTMADVLAVGILSGHRVFSAVRTRTII